MSYRGQLRLVQNLVESGETTMDGFFFCGTWEIYSWSFYTCDSSLCTFTCLHVWREVPELLALSPSLVVFPLLERNNRPDKLSTTGGGFMYGIHELTTTRRRSEQSTNTLVSDTPHHDC